VAVGRFHRKWGSIVESVDGFTVQLTVDGFPAVRIRYREGPRIMDVFAEAMAKTNHLVLARLSMAYWNPPFTREGMDDATRQKVLDRIMAALSSSGYVIEPEGGFPKPGDQLRQRIELAELMQRWRNEDELKQRWRDEGDRVEDHRRDDTPR
jgi:hypothetical protein